MAGTKTPIAAPEWQIERWFNAPAPLTLAALRGKVVVAHAFQMLCPGCVSKALPQMQKVHELFPHDQVAVVGLHTVFEHHAAMTPTALEAFLYEYKLTFPVGVDRPGEPGPLPQTMKLYGLRGTPSLLLIDRAGLLRRHSFGAEDDMVLGAQISMLMGEAPTGLAADREPTAQTEGCDDGVCPTPKS
jgi:peroxiredoxin